MLLLVNLNTMKRNKWEEYKLIISNHEKLKVMSFVFESDQQRAFISILLQKYLIQEKFKNKEVSICRTREGKPAVSFNSSHNVGNWNYNVSHHGKYVGIISHDNLLVGLDIVNCSSRPNWIENFNEFLEIYLKQLSPFEIEFLSSLDNEESKYNTFFLIWALKESYVKAIGVGIGIDLTKISFQIHNHRRYYDQDTGPGTASIVVDGIERTDWRFHYYNLDDNHLIAIAHGPCYEGLEEFQRIAWGEIQTKNESLHFERLDRELSIEFPTYFSVEDLVLSVYGKNES